ncbi:MAG: NAD(+) synthase, partial [Proteobacteria bacterium]
LGRENVHGVAMPSQYSSSHSLADAEELARNLGISYEVRPIKFAFTTLAREFNQAGTIQLAPVAEENLQSRLRGLTLMSISNSDGSLVLTTGNKSEIAMGYCTMYGDMCGALAPIGDLYKTKVYEVCDAVNARFGHPIPRNTLSKAPSAELRPDQKDQDSLPPYADLDRVLEAYIERFMTIDELARSEGEWIREIIRKMELNEYKRRQGAPALKVTSRAFGLGRRIPLAKRWETGPSIS